MRKEDLSVKIIELKVKNASEREMIELEELGVIKRLLPPEELISISEGEIVAKKVYSTNTKFGGHMLLFVNINKTEPELNYHPDNEEVLLVSPNIPEKPLIFLFCKYKHFEIEKKIESGTLKEEDFIALDIPFNNPKTSFFTVNKEFPHCEVTVKGTGISPSFWVTEPENLPMNIVRLDQYVIEFEMN